MQYPKSLVNLAVRLYRETRSGTAVAKRLDVSTTKAYALLVAGGVVLQDKPKEQRQKYRLTGDREQEAIRDYMSGLRLKDLEKKYGVCSWVIREATRRSGADIRKKGGTGRTFTEDELKQIVELHRQGLTQTQIGAALRSNQSTISFTLKRLGEMVATAHRRGKDHPSWKGGRVMIGERKQYFGVHVERDDPMACMASGQYVLEHRLVMARQLGRPLTSRETVHHINGDTFDNRLENLQLRQRDHGTGVVHRCRACGSTDIESARLN